MCTIALLFCSAETALQCESHHSSFHDFISLSLFFSGEDGDTLVSVSWVVPVTVPDKLHVTRKWRLLALIERISFPWRGGLICILWVLHMTSVCKWSCPAPRPQQTLSVQSRERKMSKAAKLPCLYLIYFALSLMLFISSLLFSLPISCVKYYPFY